VNIKWYAKLENVLDITPAAFPDEDLVLTGPRATNTTSRGAHRPWLIAYVFLFDAVAIIRAITARGSKVGIASSVPRQYWDAAEI
jgi:hypothetical protein